MKNTIVTFLIAIAVIFIGGNAKAQTCPGIQNNLMCPITVQVDISTQSGMICTVCTSTNITVPAGGNVTFPCGTCSLCRIKVLLLTANSVSLNPVVAAELTTPGPGPSTGVPGGPCGSGGAANIYFNGTDFVVF